METYIGSNYLNLWRETRPTKVRDLKEKKSSGEISKECFSQMLEKNITLLHHRIGRILSKFPNILCNCFSNKHRQCCQKLDLSRWQKSSKNILIVSNQNGWWIGFIQISAEEFSPRQHRCYPEEGSYCSCSIDTVHHFAQTLQQWWLSFSVDHLLSSTWRIYINPY